MTVVAVLQARMSSYRLPGKVLMPILGRPMLAHQIERLLRCRGFDMLAVATSEAPEDAAIVALCEEVGVACIRGSLDDVLDRVYRTARRYYADHVVRLTGDCPLADPEVIERVVRFHLDHGFDYTTNVFPPSWPDGLDVEVVKFQCLEEAWREARLPSEHEHVTSFIETRPERYQRGNVEWESNFAHLRWTVDEPEDFELVRRIYTSLYPGNPTFATADVLALIEAEPDLARINAGIDRNAGFVKALAADREFLAQQAERDH